MATLRIFYITLVLFSVFIFAAGSARNANLKYTSKLDSGVSKFNLPAERTQNLIQEKSDSVGRSIIAKSFVLAPLGLLLIAIAFLTLVPVPVAGRGSQPSENNALELARKVVSSEECLERLSCELSPLARNFEATSWIPKSIGSYKNTNRWMEKLAKGMNSEKSCRQFACSVV